MEPRVYYKSKAITVGDNAISIGSRLVSPAEVQSFDVRLRWLGLYKPWHYVLFWPLFALVILGWFVTPVRWVEHFLGRTPTLAGEYAQDWLDFIFPVAAILLGLFYWLIIKGPRIIYRIVVNAGSGEASETILGSDSALVVRGSLTLVAALQRATQKTALSTDTTGVIHGSTVFYADGLARVASDFVEIGTRRYALPLITSVAIKRQQQSRYISLYHMVWFPIWLVWYLWQLLSHLPYRENGVLLIPTIFLAYLSLLPLIIPAIMSFKLAFTAWKNPKPTYVLTLLGRFGQYNKDVVLPSDVLTSPDGEQLARIKAAIDTALDERPRPAELVSYPQIRHVPVTW